MSYVQFPSHSAQEICDSITSRNNCRVHELVSTVAQEDVFTEQEQNSGLNLLGIAIDSGNIDACAIIINSVSFEALSNIVKQKDKAGNTCYHRFAGKIFGKEQELHRFSCAYFYEPKLLPGEFREPEFHHPLAQSISHAINQADDQKLEHLIENASTQELASAISVQDKHKKINVVAFAAHVDNANAIKIISSHVNTSLLKEILLQVDTHGWSAFHHLALMNDGGDCYRNLKCMTGISTKKITRFFCESPSMLRKYIRPDPSRFSTSTKKENKKFHLYLREGTKRKIEHRIDFEECRLKWGHLFTKVPENFKVIPHATPSCFKKFWTNAKQITRDEEELPEIDQHLRAIYDTCEERDLALTTIEQLDDGTLLPSGYHVGLGVEARYDFKKGQLITLYAGEQLDAGLRGKGDYVYGRWDGARFRSHGSMMLHSAPNARFHEVSSMLGPFVGMFTNDSILSGELVCVSYGSDYFACRNITPIETRPKARRKMQESHSLDPKWGWIQSAYLDIPAPIPTCKQLKP